MLRCEICLYTVLFVCVTQRVKRVITFTGNAINIYSYVVFRVRQQFKVQNQ